MAGRDLGVSDWLSLDQPRINRFADATDDHQCTSMSSGRCASSAVPSLTAS